MSRQASLHMGHGQMVEIVGRDAGNWDLVFSEAGIENYKAPPVAEVEVDAIDREGTIVPLAISSGGHSIIRASGEVAGACRARVRVVHGTHFHTREALLPGVEPAAARTGPHGGSLVGLTAGHAVEIKWLDETRWELFFSVNGAPTPAPPAGNVVVQAIGPRAEDYQIRNLVTETGGGPTSLIASGKIKDASDGRISVRSASGETIRGFVIAPRG